MLPLEPRDGRALFGVGVVKMRIEIELDDEALEAFGRGIGQAIGEQLDAALLRLHTALQAANWHAWGRAKGAVTEDVPMAPEMPAPPADVPDGGGMAEAPPLACAPDAPSASPPVRRRRELTGEALEQARANAAKARAGMAAKRATVAASAAPSPHPEPIKPEGPRVQLADYDQVAGWAGPRGIAFPDWSALGAVNVKRVELKLPPFARRLPVRA